MIQLNTHPITTHSPKRRRWFAAAALSLAVWAPEAQLLAAGPPPQAQTHDLVASRVGVLRGSTYTADSGGHTAAPGDYAIDFGVGGSGPVYVAAASFLNTASVNDEMTIAFWVRKYDIANSSAFWANAPSVGGRGFQVHTPWSDNVVYYDTSGCCGGGSQRINANINTFPPYQAVGDVAWWYDWHYFVFSKKGTVKQVWIDGIKFLEGTGTTPLATDFTDLYIGSDGTGASVIHGLIDDFTVFSTQLNDEQIMDLFSGTLPTDLDPSVGLMAYWDFNDFPAEGLFGSVLPTPGTTTAAPNLIQVVHIDGDTAWTDANVSIAVDGTAAAFAFDKVGTKATLSVIPNPLFAIQSAHTVTLIYPASGGSLTSEWSFVVGPYTADVVASRVGTLTGGSLFTPNGGGHTGAPGDFGIDFKAAGTGPIVVSAGAFLNEASAVDQMTFAFWARKYDIAAGSAFWALSPSSNNGQRGYQAHVPWSDDNIYFDSAGCCNADQRISAAISTFPPYQAVGNDSWWQDWHFYAFSKNGGSKQVWIDGQLFLEGLGSAPLPQDFTSLMIGSDNAGGGLYHAVIDDFSIFKTQLSQDDLQALYAGDLPPDLDPSTGLIAYWDFNDIPSDGLFLSFVPTPGSTSAPPSLVQVVNLQGSVGWDLSKVSLAIDGNIVSADVTLDAGKVTVSYVPNPAFAPFSTHTATLSYPSSGGGQLTKVWSFTVGKYTKDVLHAYVGQLTGAADFTADGGGHSGATGDYAIDLGTAQTAQSVFVLNAAFMNAATVNDEMAIVGWQKLHAISASAFFWGTSPSSDGGQRGWGTHAPWSDSNLYFDTAGCCVVGSQRMSANISTFPLYSGDVSWWYDWHHVIFQKKQGHKEIWIDGQLFLQGDGANPLPTDFTQAYIGRDPVDAGAALLGTVDDVAIFAKALDGTAIEDLAAGVPPTDLDPDLGLMAYWNFNDPPSAPVRFLSIQREDATHLLLTWTGGTPPYKVERKLSLSDPLWTEVVVTPAPSASVLIEGKTGFFRVSDQATP